MSDDSSVAPANRAPANLVGSGARDALVEYVKECGSRSQNAKYRPLSEAMLKSANSSDVGGVTDLSHTFFNGGKAKADPDTCDRAARMYAVDIVRADTHEKVTTIERYNPEKFPLFIDVDLKTFARADEAAASGHAAYWDVVLTQIRRFYPNRDPSDPCFRLIICSRRPEMEPGGGIKFGYHLHFPDLFVDVNRALYIRESIVTAMRAQFGERTAEGSSWDSVFDGTVYGNKGLRPFGSYKKGGSVAYWPSLALLGTCEPDTERQALIDRVVGRMPDGGHGPRQQFAIEQLEAIKDDIDAVDRVVGKIKTAEPDSESARQHVEAIKDDNAEVRYIGDLILLVELTRLRVSGALTTGWEPWSGAPAPSFRRTSNHRIVSSLEDPRSKSYENVVHLREEAMQVITELIRSAMPPCFSNAPKRPIWPSIEVRDLHYKRTKTKKTSDAHVVVSVRGAGSSKCLNLHARNDPTQRGGDHSSNHIYFILRPGRNPLRQCCYSTNGYDRRYCHCTEPVTCKEFRSERHLACIDTGDKVTRLFETWAREGVSAPSYTNAGAKRRVTDEPGHEEPSVSSPRKADIHAGPRKYTRLF